MVTFIAATETKSENQKKRVHNCKKKDRQFNLESNCYSKFEHLINISSIAFYLPTELIHEGYFWNREHLDWDGRPIRRSNDLS